MNIRIKYASTPLALLLSALPLVGQAQETQLDPVVVSAPRTDRQTSSGVALGAASLAPLRSATSDTASLLRDVPGVSFYGNGGVSSLPVIHGLADDRVRVKVDGMDLVSACANHMNPPLSYIDPSNVGNIKVFAGIAPVSQGGDSIAGTIAVSAPTPEFAKAAQDPLYKGQAGTFYRSNGSAHGANLAATVAGENLNVSYSGSTTESGNVKSAKNFKNAAQSVGTNAWLAGDEVGSSRYKSENQSLGVALRHDNGLVELKLGYQHIPYQGFPNQWMDMTDNSSHQINLRYTGQFQWGGLEARVYNENTRHKMNFLIDRLTIGSPGMPMDTEGKTSGALLKADVELSERDTLRIGSEYQHYRLNDWWDPTSATANGMMSPNTFWNISNGQRDRVDVFAEWEASLSQQWLTQVGLRSTTVKSNAGAVQGYNNANATGGMMPMKTNYVAESTAFNALARQRTDQHWDLTALARFTSDATQSIEGGYARKTRSPNLYERYTWSTSGMSMQMINMAGDGNGYVGNINLKPEVANTLSVTADWHDAAQEQWGLKLTPYYTRVTDYIDASRCPPTGVACGGTNASKTTGFVYMQFANQAARLYGADISGHLPLARTSEFGSLTATAVLSYVNGKNLTTGDNLYDIMPLNAKFAVVQRQDGWSNTLEAQAVAAKTRVSQVRDELKTGGYGLVNLRSSKEWQQLRLDLGIENLFNRFYAPPLGGAYLGQKTAAWGTPVPGLGRSIYAGANFKF